MWLTRRDEGKMEEEGRRMRSLRLSREDDGPDVDGVLADAESDAKK